MKHILQNFILKIRNAALIRKKEIHLKNNETLLLFVKLFYKEGLLESFTKSKKIISISLRYNLNKNIFKYLKIISKTTKPFYLRYNDVCKLYVNKIFVFSTNKGILTGFECKKFKIGGKLLFVT